MFEDAWHIVLDKPAGLPVRAKGQRASLERMVERYLRLSRDNARPSVVHEPDQAASGLVVLAKHPRAAVELRNQLAPRRPGRSYIALVGPPAEGQTPPDTTTLQSVLAPSARGVSESVPTDSTRPQPRHRPAVTHVRTLRVGEGGAMLLARCETDVPYQVRAHLAESGRPVVGDRAYSGPRPDVGRVCLHLSELVFGHPRTGQTVRYRSPAPALFDALLEGREDAVRTEVTDAEGRPAGETSWDHVADWYQRLLADRGSDHHSQTIIPGALRLLGPRPGERVLDIACGQGVLARAMRDRSDLDDVGYVGVDAAPALIEAARAAGTPGADFVVGDARELDAAGLEPGSFDAAACVLALMNIDPLDAAAASAASMLRPGGRLVAVVLHPAFRSPGRTHWGWAPSPIDGARVQFRRVDAYLSEDSAEIVMNPGGASSGADPVTTVTHLRPIGRYVGALAGAGLVIDAVEEWTSARTSEPGPNAAEEDRARAEIPMFLAIRAVRPSHPPAAPAS